MPRTARRFTALTCWCSCQRWSLSARPTENFDTLYGAVLRAPQPTITNAKLRQRRGPNSLRSESRAARALLNAANLLDPGWYLPAPGASSSDLHRYLIFWISEYVQNTTPGEAGMPYCNRKVLVCGAGGFIGSHRVRRLKCEGFWVRGVDIKYPEFRSTAADEFIKGDLKDPAICCAAISGIDDVYQLAAHMGGAGYIFTGEYDAAIMHRSALINLNMTDAAAEHGVRRIFYSSSACIYPAYNQEDPNNPNCAEDSAYSAAPDSEYGWEKLFSERLYLACHRNAGIAVRIARFHNIFGPEGTWDGGREKAPAAICRKVAQARKGGTIEIWGDGQQTRSFLYVDECVEGIRRLVESEFIGPVNIGSEEMITIDDLARMAMKIAGKRLHLKHVPGPLGVRGRNSYNHLIRQSLGWAPSQPLEEGIRATYQWIAAQIAAPQVETPNALGSIRYSMDRSLQGEGGDLWKTAQPAICPREAMTECRRHRMWRYLDAGEQSHTLRGTGPD